MTPDFTIIIPAHNEERRISITLEDYCSFFSRLPRGSVEILVVLNGCTDNTLSLVKTFERRYPFLSSVDIREAIGKGGAVVEGFKRARGKIVGYADADDATQAQYYYQLITQMGDADGAIASRWIKGAVVEPRQPLSRRFASRAFNLLVRFLFGLRFYDTQCGCKVFRKEALASVLSSLSTTRWAFDVDLLYQLRRRCYRVKEIPTVWHDRLGSGLRVSRVSVEMFLAMVRLRLFYSPLRFVVGVYNKLADIFGIRF